MARILVMGLPGVGKTHFARALANMLHCEHYDADVVRHVLNDWDFSPEGRLAQATRMRNLCNQHDVAIASFVCPTIETRKIFSPSITYWINKNTWKGYQDTDAMWEPPTLEELDILIEVR